MVKISIITTTRNAAGTIRDCLESVNGQTYSSVEHIVVDAASTDGTVSILEQYREGLARVVSEPDRGIYDGMNKGLALATGDVVGILNGDDVYYSSDVLEKVARVFVDGQVDSCYGDLVYVKGKPESKENAKGLAVNRQAGKDIDIVRYWKSGGFDLRRFYWGWMVPHPTLFVRHTVYEEYGYFNLSLGTAADYEMMLRLLCKFRISTVYVPEILVMMRSGGASNVTLRARWQANRMDRKAWEVNGLKPYPWTLWLKPLRKVGQWLPRTGL